LLLLIDELGDAQLCGPEGSVTGFRHLEADAEV
jgi:hypothetical protein